MTQYVFDEKDKGLVTKIATQRDAIEGPRIGDFIRFPTGELERFSHDHGANLQTSPEWAGSYCLHSPWASFSGSLNPGTPRDQLVLTDEIKEGRFWFFHHGEVGAHRGVDFNIPCRVFTTTAAYTGYITKDFK